MMATGRRSAAVTCELMGHCNTMVDRGSAGVYHAAEDEPPERFVLARCTNCRKPLLVNETDYGYGFDDAVPVYPAPRQLSAAVPRQIRSAFDEARRCLQAKCFIATALMCRRTIEAVTRHHAPSTKGLAAGLKKLREDAVIDRKLFEWAEALREDGNLAAHDPTAAVDPRDAADLVDFTEAILDYVFVLHERFERFKLRKAGGGDVGVRRERCPRQRQRGCGGVGGGRLHSVVSWGRADGHAALRSPPPLRHAHCQRSAVGADPFEKHRRRARRRGLGRRVRLGKPWSSSSRIPVYPPTGA